MWTAPTNLLTALQGNQAMSYTAICTKQDTVTSALTQASIPIVLEESCGADARLNSRIARTAKFTVPRTFIDAGWLNPLTDHVTLRTGVAGVGEVPIFYGRPLTFRDDTQGRVQVQCVDIADDIVNNDFGVPWVPVLPSTYVTEFTRIVRDCGSAYTVDTSRAADNTLPNTMWNLDRGQTLDTLATALNNLWLADRTGSLTLFLSPYAQVNPVPAFTIKDGVGGALVQVERTLARPNIYNSITVLVEFSSQPPLAVTVRDLRSDSPTRWGDGTPFGKRNKTYTINTATNTAPPTLAATTALATRLLAQSLSLAETWVIRVPHLPIFDPGDILAVWYRGNLNIVVVESVSYNLRASDLTELGARTLVSNTLTVVGTT